MDTRARPREIKLVTATQVSYQGNDQMKDLEYVGQKKGPWCGFGLREGLGPKVELSQTPHLLLLQVRNSTYKLPGGRLRPGESDIEGLKRKLTNKLSVHCDGIVPDWEVGECLGRWWRVGFETLLLPYLPPNVRSPKECRKIFLVKLPERQKFTVPKTYKLLVVPLSQLHENHEIYGPEISGVPQLLSKFPIETASG